MYGAPDEPDVIGDDDGGGEPGRRRSAVFAWPRWLEFAWPVSERAERLFARRSWLAAGGAVAAAVAAGMAVVLSLSAPVAPNGASGRPAAPPVIITTAMVRGVGPDGVFARGTSGKLRWRLALQDIADPGYPCQPGVTVNGSDADPLPPGQLMPTPVGDPAFVTLGAAVPGTGFAFIQVAAGTDRVWPDTGGAGKVPSAGLQPAAVTVCGRTFHLVGFAYRLTARLRLHTTAASWLAPSLFTDPAATLPIPQVDGIWQSPDPSSGPPGYDLVDAGAMLGQRWSMRVASGAGGDCYRLDTGLLPDGAQQGTSDRTYCAPISTPSGLDAIVAFPMGFPDAGGQGYIYAVSVSAATAGIGLTLADGRPAAARVQVVHGRKFAAFAVTAPAGLVGLSLLGPAGQLVGFVTALPRFGYLQFQP